MRENIFDRIVRFFDRTEVSFITLIAKIIPLLVPIIPAYVGYAHVVDQTSGLGFDPWAGWIYGAVIEGLGYAAIYKAVQFWEHNRKYTAERNQAPLLAAVAIYLVYLLVTLSVNVMLDYKAGVEIYKVTALGLISLLSVPAGLLMSISAVHTERTNEREKKNEQTRAERTNRTNEQPTRRTNERTGKVKRANRRTNEPIPMPTNERTEQPMGFRTNEPGESNKQNRLYEHITALQANGHEVPGPSELARQLNMSKSYVSEQLKKLRQ